MVETITTLLYSPVIPLLWIVGALVSIIGLIKNKVWLVIIGGTLLVPFGYHIGSSQEFRAMMFIPLLHLVSAYMLYKKNKGFALVFLLPTMVTFILLSPWIILFTFRTKEYTGF